MILILLRLAVNIERTMMDAQDHLFFQHRLISTRLLPPAISVGTLPDNASTVEDTVPLSVMLERTRKTHYLQLSPSSEEPRESSVIGVPVHVEGLNSLRKTLRIGEWESDPFVTEPRIVLAWESPRSLSPAEHAELHQLPVPRTEALWLTAIDLTRGSDAGQWWLSAQWKELFRRRTTTRERGPGYTN